MLAVLLFDMGTHPPSADLQFQVSLGQDSRSNIIIYKKLKIKKLKMVWGSITARCSCIWFGQGVETLFGLAVHHVVGRLVEGCWVLMRFT